MQIDKKIAQLSIKGKCGREIVATIDQLFKYKLSLKPEQTTESMNDAGFWAEVLPYDESHVAIHVTDRPIAEHDPTLDWLQKFGARALPFHEWYNYEPKAGQVLTPDREDIDRFNPPKLTEDEMNQIVARLTGHEERCNLFQGDFLWVKERRHVNGSLNLLDLTKPSFVNLEFSHDVGYIELIGFDQQGGVLLSNWQAFCYDKSAWSYALPSGHRFYISETAVLDKWSEVDGGRITIFYRPKIAKDPNSV